MIQSEDLSMQFLLVGHSHGPLFMSTYTVTTFWELSQPGATKINLEIPHDSALKFID